MEKNRIHDYLLGKCSRKEELEIQMMLSEGGDDAELLRVLDEEFGNMTADAGIDTGAALDDVKSRLGYRSRRRVFHKFLKAVELAAAVVAIPLAVALALNLSSEEENLWHELNVPVGQTDSLLLSDGSLLVLNGGTRVTYPDKFDGETRTIFMDGEVLADIASDEEIPFEIRSGETTVKVYGTRFDFTAYKQSECVELLLIEGSVAFNVSRDSSERSLRLSPGDALHYNRKTSQINIDKFAQDSYESFAQDGSIHFFNLNMRDIVNYLEKTFGTPIIIKDNAIASMQFYGYFTNGEGVDEILDCLNVDGNMKIERCDDTIYLSLR